MFYAAGVTVGFPFDITSNSKGATFVLSPVPALETEIIQSNATFVPSANSHSNLDSTFAPVANNFDANLSPLSGNEANQMMYIPANNLLIDDVCAFTITDLNITVFNVDGSSRIVENVAFAIAHASANNNMQRHCRPKHFSTSKIIWKISCNIRFFRFGKNNPPSYNCR